MNTIELTEILDKLLKRSLFLGVFACDQLPKLPIKVKPAALVINTDPSYRSGQHWLSVYIDKYGVGSFFDSFGNPPTYAHFSESINVFLKRNCTTIQHSARQVQDVCTAVCGQHCVFFLYHMDTGQDYDKVMRKYTYNLSKNDVMVCKFVKKIRPSVVCRRNVYACIQCALA